MKIYYTFDYSLFQPENTILLESLAELHQLSGKYREALKVYLSISTTSAEMVESDSLSGFKWDGLFRLVEDHSLFELIENQVIIILYMCFFLKEKKRKKRISPPQKRTKKTKYDNDYKGFYYGFRLL